MAARKLAVELELPEELLSALGATPQQKVKKVKEALVLYLLRQKKLSQGKAAELLKISRSDLFELMAQQEIPAADLSGEELEEGLANLRGALSK